MSVAGTIGEKLDGGTLPLGPPLTMVTHYGRWFLCDACDHPILPAQTECELQYVARPFRMHIGCFGRWEAERHRRGESP